MADHPAQDEHEPPQPSAPRRNQLAAASAVAGILALSLTPVLVWLPYVPLALAAAAIATAVASRRRGHAELATTGIRTAAASIVLLGALYTACFAAPEPVGEVYREAAEQARQRAEADPTFMRNFEQQRRELREQRAALEPLHGEDAR